MGLQADVGSGLKVKELNELLGQKGVKGRGPKPQKSKQVALVCTAEEVQAFRAEKEAAALAAARAPKREPGRGGREAHARRSPGGHARGVRPRGSFET